MSGTYYRKQENKSCCPVCGKEYRASEFRRRWDGLWVCWKDYEERHPQDFVRARPDDMRPAVVAGCCGSDGIPQIAVSAVPLCPFPLEPLNDTVIDNTTSVNLSFTTFVGVTSYRIYFWEDGDPQPATATYTTTTSPYFVTGLTEATGYYWFVTAANEDGEFRDCSGNARFFTTGQSLPACPVLVSPADGASLEDDSVTLDWDASATADSYNVYLATDGGPLTFVANTASTSYLLEDLDIGASFVWMIRAVNEAGEAFGCGSRSFDTNSVVLVTVYDTPGEYSFEFHPLAVSIEPRVLGAGGGGGGGRGGTGGAGFVVGGSAGGGGAGKVQTFTPAEIAGPITVTVGVGGTGGAGGLNGSDGSDGTAGTASSFGALVVAGGGGAGAGGRSAGANIFIGGGGGGGVPNNGGNGALETPGAGGTTGGADGGNDIGSSQDAEDAPAPSTDFGGGGGGAGDQEGTLGSVSLWGGPGGGGGSSSFNITNATAFPGANGTPSTGATETPSGGAVNEDGENGLNPADPLLLAGSSGAGGGGSGSNVVAANTGLGGSGGNGGRGAGGGGGGGVYASLGQAGAGGTGGNGYVVVIQYFE